jgi:zinc protease
MNLRENKHWSYGAGSVILPAKGQRVFVAYAPVQTDKTKESIVEISNELRAVLKDKLLTADELGMSKTYLTQALPGIWETNDSVVNAIGDIVQFGLPPDYYSTYSGKVMALTLNDLNQATPKVVRPDNLIWVIVGDREKIEKGIRELNIGDVQFIDADGKPVQ